MVAIGQKIETCGCCWHNAKTSLRPSNSGICYLYEKVLHPKVLRYDYRERDDIRTGIKYQIDKLQTKCIIGNKTGAGTRYP
jgi:hypothetical protein